MPEITLDDVTLAYDVFGDPDGDPVVLIGGCGQPALAWQVGVVPALVAAGYRVVTFDNRGVAPSSSPPAPYSVDADGRRRARVARPFAASRPRTSPATRWAAGSRRRSRPAIPNAFAPRRSSGVATRRPRGRRRSRPSNAISPASTTTCRRCSTRPRRCATCPNKDLQDDALVDTFLGFMGDQEPWPNPGRLGQYEACLAWSTESEARRRRGRRSRYRA